MINNSQCKNMLLSKVASITQNITSVQHTTLITFNLVNAEDVLVYDGTHQARDYLVNGHSEL